MSEVSVTDKAMPYAEHVL